MTEAQSEAGALFSNVRQTRQRVENLTGVLRGKLNSLPPPDAHGGTSPGAAEVRYFGAGIAGQELEHVLHELKVQTDPLRRQMARCQQELHQLPIEGQADNLSSTAARSREDLQQLIKRLHSELGEMGLTIRFADDALAELRGKGWPGGNPRDGYGNELYPKPKELFGTSAKPTGPPVWDQRRLRQQVEHRGKRYSVDPKQYPGYSIERAEGLSRRPPSGSASLPEDAVWTLESQIEELAAHRDETQRRIPELEARARKLEASVARLHGEAPKRELEWALANARAEVRRYQTVAIALAQRLGEAHESLRLARVRVEEDERRRKHEEVQRGRAMESERR